MTIEEIERLIRRLAATDITELEVSDDTSSLSVKMRSRRTDLEASEPDPGEGPGASSGGERVLRAAAIGRLRLRHPEAASDQEPVFPRSVACGEVVAFLEAGGCLRPLVAEHDCTIGAPLLADGMLVGYGMPVFPLL